MARVVMTLFYGLAVVTLVAGSQQARPTSQNRTKIGWARRLGSFEEVPLSVEMGLGKRPGVEWHLPLHEVEYWFAAELYKRALLGIFAVALFLAWLLVPQERQPAKVASAVALDDERRKVAHLLQELKDLKAERAAQQKELEALRCFAVAFRDEASLMSAGLLRNAQAALDGTHIVEVQCPPGVAEEHLEIELLASDAVIRVLRPASAALPALRWERVVAFPPEEGHVEFQAEEAHLDGDILRLPFRRCSPPRRRVFRLPQSRAAQQEVRAAQQEVSSVGSSSSCFLARDPRCPEPSSSEACWAQRRGDEALGAGRGKLRVTSPELGLSGLPTESSHSVAGSQDDLG
mmetsp:Transcript_102667/g.260794  ORF Transcript_102667/g.260794 Transcript_102667/m.260794 type:complete len:347 (+) Transcript_102667:50-1090(+)